MDDAGDGLAALFGSKLSLHTPVHATPHDRRKSAVAQPESHPVSPAGSDGGASTASDDVGDRVGGGGGTPTGRAAGTGTPGCIRGLHSPTSPPATSHFSIPAMRGTSLTPATALPPLLAPAAAEERVTLNLFIDSGTPLPSGSAAKHAAAAAEEAARLREELDTLRAQAAAGEQQRRQEVEQLRAELKAHHVQAASASEQQTQAAAAAGEAARLQAEVAALRAAAAAADVQHAAAVAAAAEEAMLLQTEVEALRAQAAAAEEQRAAAAAAPEPAAGMTLAVHVAEAPAAVEQPATAAKPVQLVLNVVEPPPQHHGGSSDDTSTSSAAAAAVAKPAALQQQLARSEACREELARQAGQLKGRIAKLEGTVLAGESRVKAQAAELEGLKAASQELQAGLEAAQAQVGVTPERARAERQRLAAAAAEAQAAADKHAERALRLEAVLAFEERGRVELAEFAALEHQVLAEAERGVAAEAAQWRADAGAAVAQLAEARQRLVDTDAALLQRDEEVRQLRAELEAAQAATEAAAQLASEWRQRAEQYDRDRQAAAANIRKAERELELVAQDNERMFRQLNFVRTRLVGQLAGLDVGVPDIGKLARELQSWCDRESAQRARPRA